MSTNKTDIPNNAKREFLDPIQGYLSTHLDLCTCGKE